MSGGVNDDYGAGGRSSSMDDMSSGQRCQSGELAEWRSCEQVENGTPSTSPPYWDTDDDDDIGMFSFSCSPSLQSLDIFLSLVNLYSLL